MATIEQVEKLREKANVTYDEAKTALDAANGDMLDAIIYLERQGKIHPPQNEGYYDSKSQEESKTETAESVGENNGNNGESFSSLAGRFFKWCGRIISKGNQNSFEVRQKDRIVISVPVTILVVLLILAFWIVVPLLIVGLFLNCRYVFKGPDLNGTEVNRVMGNAADAAENLKKDVMEGRSAK